METSFIIISSSLTSIYPCWHVQVWRFPPIKPLHSILSCAQCPLGLEVRRPIHQSHLMSFCSWVLPLLFGLAISKHPLLLLLSARRHPIVTAFSFKMSNHLSVSRLTIYAIPFTPNCPFYSSDWYAVLEIHPTHTSDFIRSVLSKRCVSSVFAG